MLARRAGSKLAQRGFAIEWMSLSTNPNPPPNTSRGATADLCDVFVPEPVDVVTSQKVQIAEPMFK